MSEKRLSCPPVCVGSCLTAGIAELHKATGRTGAVGNTAFVVTLLIVIGICSPATAHKITIFAAVRGGSIEGQVSLQGGAPAPDTRLTISDGAGREVVKLVTDKDGKFQFEPRYLSDYRLVANAGLGHKAETTIPASALPTGLPPADRQEPAGSVKSEPPPSSEKGEPAGKTIPQEDTIPQEEVAQQIRELSEQTAALRMELDRWREHLRLQDILGGVGYIVGITGLVFFVLGYRRKNR